MTDSTQNDEISAIRWWKVRVFYEDTDASGVVYHANYLKYMERARTHWLEQQDTTHCELAAEHKIVFTLVDADIKFRAPARLDDILDVSASIEERRRARIVFMQEVIFGDRLLIKARFTVACVRLSDFKPCALPAFLQQET